MVDEVEYRVCVLLVRVAAGALSAIQTNIFTLVVLSDLTIAEIIANVRQCDTAVVLDNVLAVLLHLE